MELTWNVSHGVLPKWTSYGQLKTWLEQTDAFRVSQVFRPVSQASPVSQSWP